MSGAVTVKTAFSFAEERDVTENEATDVGRDVDTKGSDSTTTDDEGTVQVAVDDTVDDVVTNEVTGRDTGG